MSPRSKKKRHDSVLGWVAADPWRKLAAVVLALVSWEYLDTKVNKELKVKLEIMLTKPEDKPSYLLVEFPEGFTLRTGDFIDADTDAPVQEVTVRFKGEKGRVQDLENNIALLFQPTRTKIQGAGESLEFTKDDLKHAEVGNRKDFKELAPGMTMTPARIRVRIRPNDTRPLAVREEHVLLEYEHKNDKERLSNPKFDPSSVTFSGPKEAIDGLNLNGPLLQGRVKRIRDGDPQVQVQLRVLDSLKEKDITITDKALATYYVEAKYREFEFKGVPVLIDDGALPPGKTKDMFKLVPDVIELLKIQVKGALAQELSVRDEKELQEWMQEHLRVEVYVSRTDLLLTDENAVRADIRLVPPDKFEREDLKTRKSKVIRISLKKKPGA